MEDRSDRSIQLLSVALVFIILAWITVGLRVYVRGYMLRAFALDDWLMVLTLVCAIATEILGSADTARLSILHMRLVFLEELHMELASIWTI